MLDTILATKLHLPLARGGLVPRQRLMQRLDDGLDGKLTLISAPAGFGKTTLLSQWAGQSETPVAWISLDEGDNDLSRFIRYLVAGLQTIHSELGQESLTALKSIQAQPGDVIMTALINELTLTSGPFVLILDDYHAIADNAVHQALDFLLDHLPPNLSLYIASRHDPPLALPRLRIRNELVEIKAAELRFTTDEAASFLKQASGLELTPEDIAALEAKTEGWIAGLQAAALSFRGREGDLSEFVRAFSGGHRFVLDYLVGEVLQDQPDSIQSFLLQTSVLNRLHGALCDAVTGQQDGQATLERLDRANMFIIPLDDQRRWYRYHQLFADVLRDRLYSTQADRVPQINTLASQWYETAGLIDPALDHALAAEDFERAAQLIEQMASTGAVINEPNKFLTALSKLPPGLIQERTRLNLVHAAALLVVGRLDEVEAWLEAAERAIHLQDEMMSGLDSPDADQEKTQAVAAVDSPADSYLGQAAAIRAVAACYSGEAAEAVSLSYAALAQLPHDEWFWRGTMAINIALNLGAVFGSAQEVEQAIQVMSEAATASQKARDHYTALHTLGRLGDLYRLRGSLNQASQAYRKALALQPESRGLQLPRASISHIGLALVLYEWDQLDEAERHLQKAVELGQKGGDPDALAEGYLTLARVRSTARDFAAALDLFRDLRDQTQNAELAWIPASIEAHAALIALRAGDHEAALRWARSTQVSAGGSVGFRREAEFAILARVLLADGQFDWAHDLLSWLNEIFDNAGMMGRLIEVQILEALLADARGEIEDALTILRRALSLAEPEGYIRVFVDEGEPMQTLLRKAAARGMHGNYVARLLSSFAERGREVGLKAPAVSEMLIEPLSRREVEVLRLISIGASNREIAEDLVLAVGTVKKHINNIFGKLGVKSRTQAAARARELDLF